MTQKRPNKAMEANMTRKQTDCVLGDTLGGKTVNRAASSKEMKPRVRNKSYRKAAVVEGAVGTGRSAETGVGRDSVRRRRRVDRHE
jgi:hypothetical protein